MSATTIPRPTLAEEYATERDAVITAWCVAHAEASRRMLDGIMRGYRGQGWADRMAEYHDTVAKVVQWPSFEAWSDARRSAALAPPSAQERAA